MGITSDVIPSGAKRNEESGYNTHLKSGRMEVWWYGRMVIGVVTAERSEESAGLLVLMPDRSFAFAQDDKTNRYITLTLPRA